MPRSIGVAVVPVAAQRHQRESLSVPERRMWEHSRDQRPTGSNGIDSDGRALSRGDLGQPDDRPITGATARDAVETVNPATLEALTCFGRRNRLIRQDRPPTVAPLPRRKRAENSPRTNVRRRETHDASAIPDVIQLSPEAVKDTLDVGVHGQVKNLVGLGANGSVFPDDTREVDGAVKPSIFSNNFFNPCVYLLAVAHINHRTRVGLVGTCREGLYRSVEGILVGVTRGRRWHPARRGFSRSLIQWRLHLPLWPPKSRRTILVNVGKLSLWVGELCLDCSSNPSRHGRPDDSWTGRKGYEARLLARKSITGDWLTPNFSLERSHVRDQRNYCPLRRWESSLPQQTNRLLVWW